MDIQMVLEGAFPYNTSSYTTFAEVMDGAYIEFSFWGSRNVYALGYSGSIPLMELAEKIIYLAASNPGYSNEERDFGLLFEKKLNQLYEISEHQERRANFITQFFIILRAIFYESPSVIAYKMREACLFSSALQFERRS